MWKCSVRYWLLSVGLCRSLWVSFCCFLICKPQRKIFSSSLQEHILVIQPNLLLLCSSHTFHPSSTAIHRHRSTCNQRPLKLPRHLFSVTHDAHWNQKDHHPKPLSLALALSRQELFAGSRLNHSLAIIFYDQNVSGGLLVYCHLWKIESLHETF